MESKVCEKCGYAGPWRVCGDGKAEGRLYGHTKDDHIHCDVCCGEADKADMIKTGHAILYLTIAEDIDYFNRGQRYGERYCRCSISNWPGTMKYATGRIVIGHHNMARKRYDVWFDGPDGYIWHGTQYGDNTQICHCKRTKERV